MNYCLFLDNSASYSVFLGDRGKMMMFSLDSHGDKQHKHASVFLPGEPHVDILHYDIHDDDGYGRYNLENIVYI